MDGIEPGVLRADDVRVEDDADDAERRMSCEAVVMRVVRGKTLRRWQVVRVVKSSREQMVVGQLCIV